MFSIYRRLYPLTYITDLNQYYSSVAQDNIAYGSHCCLSNFFHACFSYSTVRVLCFLGLEMTKVRVVSEKKSQTTYSTSARGSIRPRCCRLRNLSLNRLPSGCKQNQSTKVQRWNIHTLSALKLSLRSSPSCTST